MTYLVKASIGIYIYCMCDCARKLPCALQLFFLPSQHCINVECECDINGTISGSDICDRITGQCFCRPGVAMPSCSECEIGYYGNPSEGGDCLMCECPTSVNSHSPTCFLDSDGLNTCNACEPGYTGRYCEFCDNGYFGDPYLPVRNQLYSSFTLKAYTKRAKY